MYFTNISNEVARRNVFKFAHNLLTRRNSKSTICHRGGTQTKLKRTEAHLNRNSSRSRTTRRRVLEDVTSEVKASFRRFAVEPTLTGNKRQTIKARVHANVYPRQNNNNSGAHPPFGPPSCTGRKAAKERAGEGCEGRTREARLEKGGKRRERKRETVVAVVNARVCVPLSSPRAFRNAYSAFYRRRVGGRMPRRSNAVERGGR